MTLKIDSSSPSGAGRSGEIEVTPEMIRAGVRAYWIADGEFEEGEVVLEIYRAMERTRLRKFRSGQPRSFRSTGG